MSVFLIVRALFLIYPDINITYPFMAPDSYDWIANGLHYEGYDVNFSGRPPGLPLLIAILDSFGMLTLLPVLNQLILLGLLIVAYRVLAVRFDVPVAILVIIALFFNFFLQNISFYILADLYAVFFILAGYSAYAVAVDDQQKYVFASVCWSISFLFQYAVIFMVPAVFVHFLCFRRRISLYSATRAILPPILLVGGWVFYKRMVCGGFLYSGVQHMELLKLHLSSIPFYLVNTVSVLSVPLFLLLLLGIIRWLITVEERQSEFIWLNVFLVLGWCFFWVILYTWNDRRFILYLIFFLAPFIAVGLRYCCTLFTKIHLSGKILWVALYLVIVASSAIPYESGFTLNLIKLTPTVAINFREVSDPTTFNTSIDVTSLNIARNRRGFSPVNIGRLWEMQRNINWSELQRLAVLRQKIIGSAVQELCVMYDTTDGFRWYIDRNKYGNYFKMKLYLYPGCAVPNLQMVGGRLQLI
jgi:hypothetical protein